MNLVPVEAGGCAPPVYVDSEPSRPRVGASPNVGQMTLGHLSPHMRGVQIGYVDIVQLVAKWKEARSAREAHEHAMYFLALDAVETAP